jgi:hypothetical protein
MIDRAHPLPVSRQVKLVGISRSSAYYAPSPVSAADQRVRAPDPQGTLNFLDSGRWPTVL